ncbi:fatty acid desaturase family protein [Nocardia sp. NPDC059240]|uniref:fatty acid desaturase family protein n=1 Tax=Nocardia sp. NPDC059240 TaxID=3346786 RepID=UPI0036CE6ED0
MAISDVKEYAHLSDSDVVAIGVELDAIQREIRESLGERDAAYIRKVIRLQRALEISGRTVLFASFLPPAWLAGVALLGTAKIIENMEIGHNVMHGQWDWMNDPEIHSTKWEWDIADPAEHWKITHNYLHHKYTNVLGMDRDIGYDVLRVTRDQRWKPFHLGQPVYNVLLQLLFEWGVATQHLQLGRIFTGRLPKNGPEREQFDRDKRKVLKKAGKQIAKDYVLFPLLTGPAFLSTLTANFAANIVRNVWTNTVIFSGHFPDGAEKFTKFDADNETQGEWYLRQILGGANISGGPVMHFMTGNLSYHIEHHLFPDLPSNRYAEASVRVRKLCDKYDLPYTTGPLPVQYGKAWRTIMKLSLPNALLRRGSDDAPETKSERAVGGRPSIDPMTGRRRGLRTALREGRRRVTGRHLVAVS